MARKKILVLIILMLFYFGCATSGDMATKPSVQKVALVSLIVRDYGVYSHGMTISDYIPDQMQKMLTLTESTLENYWSIKPANSFINNDAFRGISEGDLPMRYFTTNVDGEEMPFILKGTSEIIKGKISKEKAMELCHILSVDAIVLIYSEWAIQTGKFVPTTKALTKNCVAMYDKTGTNLFFDRSDNLGPYPIGHPYSGGINLNVETINHWIDSYEIGLKTVLDKQHKKVE